MAKIGVIIPVYNVEKYLEKCVESILQQTFQDFEIILIDDGSTDGSGEICDAYAKKNKKIRVIHKENEGVSSARNRGLEENENELITFIDPDDWIEKHYLEILYELICRNHADLVIGGGIDVLDGQRMIETKKDCDRIISKAKVISKSEAYGRMLACINHASIVAWAKIYRKKLFETVRYPVGEICEDSRVIDGIIERCDRIVCTAYAGYYYFSRDDSLIHSRILSDYKVGIRNAKRLWKFIKVRYPEIEDAARAFYYNNCLQTLNYLVMDVEGKHEKEIQALRREILKAAGAFFFNRYTKPVEKCGIVCLIIGSSWYRIMLQSYYRLKGKK